MLAGIFSDADAQVAVAAIVAIGGFLTLYIRQGRMSTSVDQINRSVNHQPLDGPTLVERVIAIEHDTAIHRRWEHKAFGMIATQVGCVLPPHPSEEPQHEGDTP